jgi:hypothetical protein
MIHVADSHIREIEELNFTNGLRSKQPPIAKFSNCDLSAQPHVELSVGCLCSPSNFWPEDN